MEPEPLDEEPPEVDISDGLTVAEVFVVATTGVVVALIGVDDLDVALLMAEVAKVVALEVWLDTVSPEPVLDLLPSNDVTTPGQFV